MAPSRKTRDWNQHKYTFKVYVNVVRCMWYSSYICTYNKKKQLLMRFEKSSDCSDQPIQLWHKWANPCSTNKYKRCEIERRRKTKKLQSTRFTSFSQFYTNAHRVKTPPVSKQAGFVTYYYNKFFQYFFCFIFHTHIWYVVAINTTTHMKKNVWSALSKNMFPTNTVIPYSFNKVVETCGGFLYFLIHSIHLYLCNA